MKSSKYRKAKNERKQTKKNMENDIYENRKSDA